MAKLLKLRRGTTSQHSSFTGAEGECTVDTTKDTLVVHDGSTAGGRPLLRQDLNNIGTGVITAAMMGANSVDSSELVDGSIDASHIASNAVTTAKINADAVTGAKIADDSINSEHYVNGSIDTAHIADSQITGAKIATPAIDDTGHLADDVVTGAKIAHDTITATNIAANAVGSSELAADAVTGAQIADDAINSEHYVNGSIDHAHLAGDCVDGDNIADDSINSEHYVNGSIDHAHLAGDCVDGDNIANDSINSEHYVDGSIDHAHLAGDCVDGDNISNDSINSEHYVDGSIDTAHIADNQVTLAKMAGLARGKIIYGNSSGDPAALAVGSANQVLTSDGTDISWAAAAGGAGTARNLLINGSFNVNQRGDKSDIGGSSVYILDRWMHGRENGGNSTRWTISRTALAKTDLPYTAGHRNCMKLDCTTSSSNSGNNDTAYMNQRIEGFNCSHLDWGNSGAKTLTLSFYAKTDGSTGVMSVSVYATKHYIREVSLTNSWQKFTVTFPGNTSDEIAHNNANGLQLMFVLHSGSDHEATINTWGSGFEAASSNQVNFGSSTNNNIYIAGVQLEVGSSATDFEHIPYGEELLKCQRYCMRWDNDDTSHGNHARMPVGMITGGSQGSFPMAHSVPMRATDGRAIEYSISTLSPQAGGGGNKTPPSLSIMGDGSSSNTTWVNMALDSGRSNNSLFHVRVGGDTDWQIVVSNEL